MEEKFKNGILKLREELLKKQIETFRKGHINNDEASFVFVLHNDIFVFKNKIQKTIEISVENLSIEYGRFGFIYPRYKTPEEMLADEIEKVLNGEMSPNISPYIKKV